LEWISLDWIHGFRNLDWTGSAAPKSNPIKQIAKQINQICQTNQSNMPNKSIKYAKILFQSNKYEILDLK
jgi:hypothetical protein